MRRPAEHAHELQRETVERFERRNEPAEQERIRRCEDGLVSAREAEPVAGRLRGPCNPLVRLAVRIGDRMDPLSRDRLELRPAVDERFGESVVVELGQPLVAERVEAEREPRVRELAYLSGSQPRLAASVVELRDDGITLRTAHLLYPLRVLVNASAFDRYPSAAVDGPLELLPPGGDGPFERRSREEKRRGSLEASENGSRELDVRGEIVVERDRDRKAAATSPRRDGREQLVGRDDAVSGEQQAHVRLEQRDRVRRDELARRVAALRCEPVVDEDEPGTSTGEALREAEQECRGAPEAESRDRHPSHLRP